MTTSRLLVSLPCFDSSQGQSLSRFQLSRSLERRRSGTSMMNYQLRHALQRLANALEPLSACELVVLSRKAGVQPRQARHILRGQTADVISFLLLCSGLGVEPTVGSFVLP